MRSFVSYYTTWQLGSDEETCSLRALSFFLGPRSDSEIVAFLLGGHYDDSANDCRCGNGHCRGCIPVFIMQEWLSWRLCYACFGRYPYGILDYESLRWVLIPSSVDPAMD
jgi:hypothetical protein